MDINRFGTSTLFLQSSPSRKLPATRIRSWEVRTDMVRHCGLVALELLADGTMDTPSWISPQRRGFGHIPGLLAGD